MKYLIVLLVLVLFFQCRDNESDYSKLIKDKSVEAIGSDSMYYQVYGAIVDSLNCWSEASLKRAMEFKYLEWRLDSVICFNSQGDRLIGSALIRDTFFPNAKLDLLVYIYGVKISGEWYFFFGATQYVYQHRSVVDGYEYWKANSLEELHQKALQYMYGGYLKRGFSGFEINDNFFKRMDMQKTEYGIGFCKTCETYEEFVLDEVRSNWEEKDTVDWDRRRILDSLNWKPKRVSR